jgi:hypothetical protein
MQTRIDRVLRGLQRIKNELAIDVELVTQRNSPRY